MNGSEHCTREEGGSRATQRRRKKSRKSQQKHEKREKKQERGEKQMRRQNSKTDESVASAPPERTCQGGTSGTATTRNKNDTQMLKRRKRGSNGENTASAKQSLVVIAAPDSLDETNIVALCNRHCINSSLRAQLATKWMLSPVDYDVFYGDHWETNPLLISRNHIQNQYNGGLVSSNDILKLIQSRRLLYGSDLDVTNYVHGRRVTLNPLPDADGEDEVIVSSEYVETKLKEGCSLRMLCPQKYFDSVHALLSALEEEWGCMVGSNVYFTPSGHQGFAPHWDEIEAFLLQVEGVKRWRVYAPTGEGVTLPRYSSGNLSPQDMSGREPIIDHNLKPGDLLYLPRGFVHEGISVGTKHSLHITISCFQRNAWVDFIEMLMPRAVLAVAEQNSDLRKGLPRNFLKYHGISNMPDEGEDEVSERVSFRNALKRHVDSICKTALSLVDETADELAKKYIGDRLPPVISTLEESSTVLGKSARDLTLSSRLRMIRAGVARLVLEDGKAVVYHAMDNSRTHFGTPLNPLEFEIDDAPAIETLLHAYPGTVSIKDLPHPPAEDPDDKLSIAQALYNEGFLVDEDL